LRKAARPVVTSVSRGHLRGYGRRAPGAVDAIPQDAVVAIVTPPVAERRLQGLLQVLPVDRLTDHQMIEVLQDIPCARGRAELELRGRQPGDLVHQPALGHLHVGNQVLPFEPRQRIRQQDAGPE
jgi:hypothetical protein